MPGAFKPRARGWTTRKNRSAAKSYAYDDHARPLATTLTVGGESFTTTLTYGPNSRVERIVYPTAPGVAPFVVQHGYDDYGHLLGVSDVSTGSPYWRFTDVDGAGRLREETFGNGVVTTRGYFDDKQRVKSIFTTNGSAAIQDLAYDYDVKLNLASRHDALQAQNKTERFGVRSARPAHLRLLRRERAA